MTFRRPLIMPGTEKPLALDLHGQFESPCENRRNVVRPVFDQMFQEDLDRRILVSVHSRFSMVGFTTPWNTRVDRPCWGMPQQGLLMPSPSEFPDFRLQYLRHWNRLKS